MGNLASAIDELAAEDLDHVGDAALGADLVELRRAIDRLEAQWLRRLRRFDRSGGWHADHAFSTQAWVRHHCQLAPGAAKERVTLARRLEELPGTDAALAAGEIGYPHARLIATTTADVCPAAAADAEPILVDAARNLDPPRLRRVIDHWRHYVDPDEFLAGAISDHEHRRLHISATFQGMVALDGMLDSEGGATVMTALDALSTPGSNDTRTPAQRRADALVELARRALDAADLPTTSGERPHLSVTVSLSTLERRIGAPAGELEWSDRPISSEAARRLACDAAISRVITDGASRPLDIGRRTRTVPPHLRRALAARDRGCVEPGCDRPIAWCDAHHIVHWIDGGPTTLANLELRCRRHHHLVHEHNPDLHLPAGRSPP
jgi:hypothetical protein